ncbi:MAG: hypothetical protein JL50_21115 [Peptococcaceae bacterium BICA1-7]|nr:MAG: hypothetical protein JL50_21115 [Peptococcaceae bacterium BICA1-7]HBV97173.1 hypothetical protein [Desulfotomaculum sp.]
MSLDVLGDIDVIYNQICSIHPPTVIQSGALEFGDLALIRTVDPRQDDYLAALAAANGAESEWARIQQAVVSQKRLRSRVFEYLKGVKFGIRKIPI